MKLNTLHTFIPLAVACFFIIASPGYGQDRDDFPVREYTNPEEMVAFDQTTSFSRALDVINEFAQKYRSKIIIDRTDTEGSIGSSIPAMHWMDALKMILSIKQLQLLERRDFYEVVDLPSSQQKSQVATASGQQAAVEGPVATTDTREVRINAIFFEGNRRALKEIGVDWSTLSENVPENVNQYTGGQGGSGGGGSRGGSGDNGQLPSSSFDGPFVQVNSKGAQSVSQNVFNALVNFGQIGNTGIEVQALFSAFEADNLGEILASPTIKVMDGQEGRIQVGQDFSIKQRDFAGNVIENFFSVGTILTVTPQIVEQNDTTFIHLNINAERSSAQPDPVSTIINKQQAETQALLLDGEATVIAGLYRTEQAEVRRGVPILKDLPGWFFGLRYLFGYTSQDYQMRELVILIQASIEPTIPERIEKGPLTDKFEVIQTERKRIRGEIEKSESIFEEKPVGKDPETEKAAMTSRKQNAVSAEEPHRDSEDALKEGESGQSEAADRTRSSKMAGEPAPEPAAESEVPIQKVNLDFSETDEKSREDSNEHTRPKKAHVPPGEQEGRGARINTAGARSQNYYIIGGSFSESSNATEFRAKLQKDGYSPVVFEKPGSNLLMVAYNGYDSFERAKNALENIQQHLNSGAWLYRAD